MAMANEIVSNQLYLIVTYTTVLDMRQMVNTYSNGRLLLNNAPTHNIESVCYIRSTIHYLLQSIHSRITYITVFIRLIVNRNEWSKVIMYRWYRRVVDHSALVQAPVRSFKPPPVKRFNYQTDKLFKWFRIMERLFQPATTTRPISLHYRFVKHTARSARSHRLLILGSTSWQR